jgi:hypothetical protein
MSLLFFLVHYAAACVGGSGPEHELLAPQQERVYVCVCARERERDTADSNN